MLNLIRADLLKIRKDKTILICLAVLTFFALTQAILAVVIAEFMKSDANEIPEFIGSIFHNAESLFLSSFNLSNNVGIIIPAILCIFIGKEFTFGTIRNKVITGQSRTTVYMSNIISTFLLGIFLVSFYAILSLLSGLIFVGNHGEIEFLNLLKAFLLGLLVYLVSFSISVFLTFITQSQVKAIIFNVVFLLFFGAVVLGLTEIKNEVLNNIISYTIFGQSFRIMIGELSAEFIIKTVLTSLIALVVINGLGIHLFKKADLK